MLVVVFYKYTLNEPVKNDSLIMICYK